MSTLAYRFGLLLLALAAYTVTAVATHDPSASSILSDEQNVTGIQAVWRKPHRTHSVLGDTHSGAPTYTIHMMTIPPHGHYMTLRDVGIKLQERGHHVSFVMCEHNRAVFERDGLAAMGIGFISAGNCSIYDEYDTVMARLVQDQKDLKNVADVLDGVANLNQQMCEAVMPYYEAVNSTQYAHLKPHVIVFDADTFCAPDISARYHIPRVARVGTGMRDAFLNPFYNAQYGFATSHRMTYGSRVINAIAILASRMILSPYVFPYAQARYREYWQTAKVSPLTLSDEVAKAEAADSSTPATPAFVDPVHGRMGDGFRYDLPWDGFPVLYNTHWGLDHPRPLLPSEHVIGHTTDFEKEAQREIPSQLLTWLNSLPELPVVYVGMGTLSILQPSVLAGLSNAFNQNTRFRFLWSVPNSQRKFFPQQTLGHTRDWEATWTLPKAGDMLLVDWAPQLAVLVHNVTRVFITHAGMNGVAEALFAGIPILCVPLFSDQPDNCQHMEDHGYAIGAKVDTLNGTLLETLLDQLVDNSTMAHNMEIAWRRNVHAGGIPMAISVIERTAQLGYDDARLGVPSSYFYPWYIAYNVDLLLTLLAVIAVLGCACFACTRCVYRVCKSCCGCARAASRVKQD